MLSLTLCLTHHPSGLANGIPRNGPELKKAVRLGIQNKLGALTTELVRAALLTTYTQTILSWSATQPARRPTSL